MKTKPIAQVALAVLLMLPAQSPGALAATTTASVAFVEGDLEFGNAELDPGLHNMNIDFGSHALPVGPSTYRAADSDHTLRVLDSRSAANAGNWYVTAGLSKFDSEDTSNTFDATIALTEPSTNFAGLTAEDPISLVSGAAAATVVTADDTLTNGSYDTTWDQANISLSINAIAAASITEVAPYEATMTWTLVDA